MAEDARRDVYRDASDVGVHEFALTGVNADADFDTQLFGIVTQRLRAPDGLGRTVKCHEVAVAGALDHRPAESVRGFGGDLAEALEHDTPSLIPRRRGALGRRDDVGEQHRAQGTLRL